MNSINSNNAIENYEGISSEKYLGIDASLLSENQKSIISNAIQKKLFVDSHIHLFGLGIKLETLSLNNCNTLEDSISKLLSYKGIYRGDWMFGFGWDDNNWNSSDKPSRRILDYYFPDTPVYLICIDGHRAWCNSKALQLSGIDFNYPILLEGLELDKAGLPTGIIDGKAKGLVYRNIPQFTDSQAETLILSAQDRLLECGVGSICDMDPELSTIRILKKLDIEDKLKIKIELFLNSQNILKHLNLGIDNFNTYMLKIKGMKLYADGTLGSHTAAMLEPYNDSPNTRGKLLLSKNQIMNNIKFAAENRLELAVHCIGDRANDTLADAVATVRSKHKEVIIRAEHSQVLKYNTVQKFADNGIIASIQPIHYVADSAGLLQSRLGTDRISDAYRWKSLVDNNIPILIGTDSPVASENPIDNIRTICGIATNSFNLVSNYKEYIPSAQALKLFLHSRL